MQTTCGEADQQGRFLQRNLFRLESLELLLFPRSETTLSRTFPFCIKNKPSVWSPWAKIVPFFGNEIISLPLPIVEIKAWGSKSEFFFAAVTCFGKRIPNWRSPLSIIREWGSCVWSIMTIVGGRIYPLATSESSTLKNVE